jgi:hypothetical protein
MVDTFPSFNQIAHLRWQVCQKRDFGGWRRLRCAHGTSCILIYGPTRYLYLLCALRCARLTWPMRLPDTPHVKSVQRRSLRRVTKWRRRLSISLHRGVRIMVAGGTSDEPFGECGGAGDELRRPSPRTSRAESPVARCAVDAHQTQGAMRSLMMVVDIHEPFSYEQWRSSRAALFRALPWQILRSLMRMEVPFRSRLASARDSPRQSGQRSTSAAGVDVHGKKKSYRVHAKRGCPVALITSASDAVMWVGHRGIPAGTVIG